MLRQWTVTRLILSLLVGIGAVTACSCPNASDLSLSPSSLQDRSHCCVNISGSDLSVLNWAWFSNSSDLKILDLSHCNITRIDVGAANRGPSSLTKLFLNHNRLSSLPRGLLSGMFNLTELDLQENRITDLNQDFLQDQNQIQKLSLRQNKLTSLPASVLTKPSLSTVDMEGNPWHCSCEFVEEIEAVYKKNCSFVQGSLANLTCASPSSLSGRAVSELNAIEVCRPAALTPLFIALPLLILSALVLCWCCGRKKAKKESPMFNSKRKMVTGPHSNGLNKPCSKPLPPPQPDHGDEEPKPDCFLQNQLLLRPSSALLSSTRDLCQGEVEGRLGSVDSLPSLTAVTTEEAEFMEVEMELQEAVNVSEVLRDSTDREKAYLTQATQYYSLVPGLQLDDWDHGEFDNVDLT